MIIVEIVMLVLLAILCGYTSFSDIKNNIIPNKVLILFWCLGVAADSVYYGWFVRDLLKEFAVNFLIIICLSLILYAAHIWAGGDSKLLILIGLLFPARLYFCFSGSNITLFLICAFSFVCGYAFLIFDSIKSAFTLKRAIKKELFKIKLKTAICRYGISVVYLTAFNLMCNLYVARIIQINQTASIILGIIIAIIIPRIKILNKIVIIPFIAFDIVVVILSGLRIDLTSIVSYILVFNLTISNILMSEYNYCQIEPHTVKKGMILATGTTLQFIGSRISGLPSISYEDQRSRISEEEAKAVISWGKTTNGEETITIVRKIPFAIFLLIGVITYAVLGGFIH